MTANTHNHSMNAGRRGLVCATLALVLTSLCASHASADSKSTTLTVAATVINRCAVNTTSIAVTGDSQVQVGSADSGLGLACSQSGQVAIFFSEGFVMVPPSATSSISLDTLVAVDGVHGVSDQADLDSIRRAHAPVALASAKTEARSMTVTLLF